MEIKPNRQVLCSLVLGVFVALALVACASGGGQPTAGVTTVTVDGLDTFKYDPATLTVKVGQPVHIVLNNKGTLQHTFVIDDPVVHIGPVQGGATGDTTFTPDKTGTYVFYCDTPGHKAAGMTGTLTVTP